MHVCTYILYDALFKSTPPHKVAVTCIPQCFTRDGFYMSANAWTDPALWIWLFFLFFFLFFSPILWAFLGLVAVRIVVFFSYEHKFTDRFVCFFCRFWPGALYHLPVQSKGLEQLWPRLQSYYNSNYPWGETVGGGPTSLASSRWKRRHRPAAVASTCQT